MPEGGATVAYQGHEGSTRALSRPAPWGRKGLEGRRRSRTRCGTGRNCTRGIWSPIRLRRLDGCVRGTSTIGSSEPRSLPLYPPPPADFFVVPLVDRDDLIRAEPIRGRPARCLREPVVQFVIRHQRGHARGLCGDVPHRFQVAVYAVGDQFGSAAHARGYGRHAAGHALLSTLTDEGL